MPTSKTMGINMLRDQQSIKGITKNILTNPKMAPDAPTAGD